MRAAAAGERKGGPAEEGEAADLPKVTVNIVAEQQLETRLPDS